MQYLLSVIDDGTGPDTAVEETAIDGINAALQAESRAAYDEAVALAGNSAEVAHLSRRRDQLGR